MPFDFGPFLRQARKVAIDFGQHVLREGLIAQSVPIDGLMSTDDGHYYVASTMPALLAAWQAYYAKGGRVPTMALTAASSLLGSSKVVLPADPRTLGDSLLVITPTELGEKVLKQGGFKKVAFIRAPYVRGRRGPREPNEVWAWVG